MKNIILLLMIFISYSFYQKEYLKNYHPNGKLKEEGWIIDDKKTDYWFYYYENGFKKEEGHYKNNQKVNWWIYYDEKQVVTKKCEFKSDKLNGLSIIYSKGEITKAEKYVNNIKVKTWTDLAKFKKDNNYLWN